MLPSKKSKDILQKRIPKNPKYENIQSTIDTGSSLNRYLKRIEDIRQNYRIRKDELFKRMKITTFVQLVLQVAEMNNHLYCVNEEETPELSNEQLSVDYDNDKGLNTGRTIDSTTSQRSTFQRVISGVGELDINNSNDYISGNVQSESESKPEAIFDSMPYLLLDVRSRDDFDQCHFIRSVSYPSAMISRSVNFEIKEMLAFRNKPGKIIIIYDDDERIAPRVADTLVQRGYDNLFMLSGGLKVAFKKFPQGLITGKIPESVRQALNTSNGKIKSKPTKMGDLPSVVLSEQLPNDGSHEFSGLKTDFTIDDLARLSMGLDEALDSKSSTSSSVYSYQTKTTNPRSISSSLTVSSQQVDHKKPFKC